MDAKERILKTINHEEADYVPSFEITIDNLSIYNHFRLKYGYQGNGDLLKKTYDLMKGDTKLLKKLIEKTSKVSDTLTPAIDLYRKMGIDLFPIYTTNFPVFYEREGFIDDYGRKFHFKKNPQDNMDISYYMGGTFKTIEDFRTFPELDPDNPMREKIYQNGKQIEKKYNSNIYVIPAIGGIFEGTWQCFGLEKFSKFLTRPEILKEIFKNRGKFAVEMIKRFIEWGEDGIVLMGDDYGFKNGLLMHPKYYEEYIFPWIKKMCEIAHRAGIKFFLHTCGDVYNIFERILACGVDMIHPIEPTTANPEFDIFKLYQKYSDRVTFVGNVSPQDLADKKPKDIQSYVKKLIRELAPGGGYILSSGHSINPAIKLENFLKMHETLKKYGKYPIKID
jgi:uroporphyrinogen-III decarboxylase